MRFPQRGPRPEGVRPGMTVDGRYLLVRGLSRGPVGEVWLADDLELGRDVVLKRLAVDGAAGSDRLWAEERALARFSHPHVVTLYHAVRGRAASWLVMEHVPGGSLEGRPGLSPGVAARIGAQIADYGNFDRCDVLVSPPSDTVVAVKVDLNLDPPPEQAKAATTTGIVTVVADPGESHACNRTLVLDGVTDTTITVTAKRDDDGEAALCDIADAATADAVRTLNRGPLARRSPGFPAESLAQQDACTLLDARALEVVPGIDAADPDRGYGGWDCEWGSTTSDTRLDLTFDRGEPPDAAGGTSTRLNGRPAYVRPVGEGEETCLVQVVHRTYPDVHGRTAAETLRILVGGSRPTERLCRMATHLADAATARLPRA
ncbi:protein kinase [Nonomuraea sp. GTA35]|uniref:protein kinase n=1 Tax=Nonomuraea sp. GTA35 TaxID=1676746 RepID=UPI0035BEF391